MRWRRFRLLVYVFSSDFISVEQISNTCSIGLEHTDNSEWLNVENALMWSGTRRVLTSSTSFRSYFLRCLTSTEGSGSSVTQFHHHALLLIIRDHARGSTK